MQQDLVSVGRGYFFFLPYLLQIGQSVRIESPLAGQLKEVMQVSHACLLLPSMAADLDLLFDFARFLAASLPSPLEPSFWQPIASTLLLLLEMFASVCGDQKWMPDKKTPQDEAQSQTTLFKKLVSSRAISVASLKSEKYDQLVRVVLLVCS